MPHLVGDMNGKMSSRAELQNTSFVGPSFAAFRSQKAMILLKFLYLLNLYHNFLTGAPNVTETTMNL